VSTAPAQILELRLAETGTELGPAVEAAQYARLIDHAPPADAAEEVAIGRFVQVFAACAEAWQGLEALRRTGLLASLSPRLDALQCCGLFVHWAALGGGIGAGGPAMPLAVLTISRVDLPTVRVQLPRHIEIGAEGGATRH
jgi:hypothetical protein